jgi:hypothetical protein
MVDARLFKSIIAGDYLLLPDNINKLGQQVFDLGSDGCAA